MGEGDAEAHGLMAVLLGMGVGVRQNWDRALDQLLAGAIAGSAEARGQLVALAEPSASAGVDTGEADPEAWRRVRSAVDPAAWTAPLARRVLNASPRIVAIERFLAAPACDWIIARAQSRLAPAKVYGDDARAREDVTGRTNSAFEFGFLDLDVVVLMVRARIAAAIGVPTAALEPPQALHYATGQRFARHHDWLDPDLAPHAADIARRGQRAVTFLIYLNEGFAGGETDFPHLGVRRKGERGEALYFGNLDAAGGPDRRTLHEGLAPTSGEKWLFSQWIRNRAVV